jgi:hypothetical protein
MEVTNETLAINSSSKHLTQSHSWCRRFQLEGFQKQGQLTCVAINGYAKEIGNAIQLLASRQSAVDWAF